MQARVLNRSEIVPFAVLALAMAATRVHHFGVGQVLPDASIAVFFLAGLWLRSPAALGVLLVEAFLLDAAAIGWANVPAVCVTPGYAMLIPAYAALWFAGRRVAGEDFAGFAGGSRIGFSLLVGVAAFFVLSNFGFYLGGGFAETHGVVDFLAAVIGYFPMFAIAAGIYVAVALAVRALIPAARAARA